MENEKKMLAEDEQKKFSEKQFFHTPLPPPKKINWSVPKHKISRFLENATFFNKAIAK